jgi:hypothetical protein
MDSTGPAPPLQAVRRSCSSWLGGKKSEIEVPKDLCVCDDRMRGNARPMTHLSVAANPVETGHPSALVRQPYP